jgi:hypothetical protein
MALSKVVRRNPVYREWIGGESGESVYRSQSAVVNLANSLGSEVMMG